MFTGLPLGAAREERGIAKRQENVGIHSRLAALMTSEADAGVSTNCPVPG